MERKNLGQVVKKDKEETQKEQIWWKRAATSVRWTEKKRFLELESEE